jgi:uncharacterized protein (DUF1697 family)
MKRGLIVVAASLGFAAGAFAEECSREAAPAVPDGANASMEEMVAGQQAVKAYLASGNAFLSCLEQAQTAAREEESEEQRAERLARYNAAVDEMQAVGDKFNAAIKAFKVANPQ